jgi:hypothetical protein
MNPELTNQNTLRHSGYELAFTVRLWTTAVQQPTTQNGGAESKALERNIYQQIPPRYRDCGVCQDDMSRLRQLT